MSKRKKQEKNIIKINKTLLFKFTKSMEQNNEKFTSIALPCRNFYRDQP